MNEEKIYCELCGAEMKYINHKDTHIWSCEECCGILFEFEIDKNHKELGEYLKVKDETKRAKTLLYNAMVMLEENIANTDGGFEEKLEMFVSLLEELGMTLQEYQELMGDNGLYNEYKEQVECSEE